MHATAEHVEPKRPFMIVWVALLVLTGFEVILAYQHLPLNTMLGMLMTLSVIKAALIISWFMHLRYEKRGLVLTLMPALVFVIGMMFVAFPDSIRLYLMGTK